MPQPCIILASRSPRRSQLLEEAGFAFTQADPPFEDPPEPQAGFGTPEDHAVSLARAKAASLYESLQSAGRTSPGLILAADTLCVAEDGRWLGTPTTAEQARAMLAGFVGRRHAVVSAVALMDAARGGAFEAFADRAEVTWGAVDPKSLSAYVAGGLWRGKAGGYNLEERRAGGWPIDVRGDPTTVVGLPMRRLIPLLKARGFIPG